MIGVFLADGFEESEGIITIDLLRRAGFDVKTISITDNNMVTSSHKIKLFTDLVWDEFNNFEYDVLVIPVNMAGIPGLNIPIGLSKDNMPIEILKKMGATKTLGLSFKLDPYEPKDDLMGIILRTNSKTSTDIEEADSLIHKLKFETINCKFFRKHI